MLQMIKNFFKYIYESLVEAQENRAKAYVKYHLSSKGDTNV